MGTTEIRWRHRVMAGLLGVGLAFGFAVAAPAADPLTPRAQAVATMQQAAAKLEWLYTVATPALDALLPAYQRFTLEHLLAKIDTGLSTYALADRHDARAQAYALAGGDPERAGIAIIARADDALILGNYARCEALAATLATLAKRSGSRWLRMQSLSYRGIVDRRHGELDKAVSHQREALHLATALGDKIASSRALTHLGTVYRDRGDFAQALDFQLQALTIGEPIGDRTELMYRNVALLYGEVGDNAQSKAYFEKAIAAAVRHGDASTYAATHGTYSSFLNDTRDYAAALDAARDTLSLDRVLDDQPAVGFEHLEIGRALIGLKRLDEAEASLQEALRVGRKLNQHEIIARSELALAGIALDQGDRKRAATLLDAALGSLNTTRLKPQLARAYALRERLAVADGDPTTALQYAHQFGALREELLGTTASRHIAALEARHARADAEQKLILANEENALQTARLAHQHLQRRFDIAIIVGLGLLLAVVGWRWLDMSRLNRALNVRNARIQEQSHALTDANQRLERQANELYQAAITDPLTGTYNRGHLLRELDRRIAECTRDGRELALLMIDFDHFKRINDTRGHMFGDRVLVAGVQTIRQWLDPGSIFGRFGGEEFLIVTHDQDVVSARACAERLRQRIADDLSGFASESQAYVTISVGVALLSQIPSPPHLEDLIEAADRAVYAAKTAGRNRVMLYAA